MIAIKDHRTEVGAKLAIGDVLSQSDGLYMIVETANSEFALLNLEKGLLSKAYDNVWDLAQVEIESDAELANATMTLTNWRVEK